MTRPGGERAAWLRALPSLTGTAPAGGAEAPPREPEPLFVRWLEAAVGAGVAEPHAATLATVGEDGVPDARTLILKDVGRRGWAVAGRRSSRKGLQLAADPVAALNFWWPSQMRAVRVRGAVTEATAEDSAADFASRASGAREGVADADWVLWRIAPSRVEFWQGARDRRHVRMVYERGSGGWNPPVLEEEAR
ncbi:pyridoxine/pyridoxamine 5'-phosphate oxidase [Microbacterium marinilacus]|uniref:Pyridoxamine 5'-phosphate oxidase n=1 Tax=Microbacterium marinilacus TaxID=415209 RepID=A0ABP7BH06_9MICO|nr:pyridoxamine 5'-phosphate oxidase family protein [Microbacterium marinilacus]MBY0688503.1 pyridoxamine 5'-phosphate oxidase family protein [Microbacterium marinilacus]